MKRDPVHQLLTILASAFAISCWWLVLVRTAQHFFPA